METNHWQWFDLSALFSLKRGTRLTKPNRELGSIPLVTAGKKQEGVEDYISNEEQARYKNAITIDMFGFSCYREYEFCCDDNILVLENKFLTKFSGIFIATIISKDEYRCAYGRQYRQKNFAKHKIKLPAILNAQDKYEPDWIWMENYVKETLIPELPQKTKAIWQKKFENKQFSENKLNLNIHEWHWFRYDEVFEICKGFYNKKPEEVANGVIPFIGATDSNNGITSLHTLDIIKASSKTGAEPNASLDEKLFSPNCITVSNDGSVGYAFFQNKKFTCSHSVNPLYLNKKWKKVLNPYIAMFLCTIIEREQFRWAYGRKWRPKRMPNSLIKLPVTLNSKGEYEPDWQWMEDYIKGLPYSSCLY